MTLPAELVLPTDSNVYYSQAAATAAKESSFTSDSHLYTTAGKWTFSGWDNGSFNSETNVVTFNGTWTYTAADEIVTGAYSFTVNKVDGTGNALAGAEFTLTKGAESFAATKNDAGTSFTFSNLGEGEYTLTETAPEGYTPAGPWTVTVAHDGSTTVSTPSEENGNVINKIWNWIVSAVTGESAANEITNGVLTVTNTARTVYYYRIDRVYTTTTDGVVAGETVTGAGSELFSSYDSSFTVAGTAIDGYPAADGKTGFTYAASTTTVSGSTTQAAPAVITLNYSKTVNNSYNVTYYVNDTQVKQEPYTYKAAVTAYAYSAPTGSTFHGWYSDEKYETSATVPATMPANDLVFYGYTSVNSYAYTVNYYKDSIDAANLLGSDLDSDNFGAAILYTDGKYIEAGYVTPGAVSGQRTVTEIAGNNVLNVVYGRSNSLGYTVHYYYDGVLDSTKTDAFTGKTLGDSITSVTDKSGTGYSQDTINSTDLPYTIKAEGNVIDIYYTRDTGMLIVSKTFNDSVFTPESVTVTVTGPDGYNEPVTLNKDNGWTWKANVPTGEYTVTETANGATGYYTCVTSYLDGDSMEGPESVDGKVTVRKTAAVVAMAVADVPGAWVTITNTYTYNPPYIPDPTPTPTPTPTPSEEPTPEPSEPPEEDLGDADVPLGPAPGDTDLGEDQVPMDDAPQTGDSSNAALMWLLLCASFSGLVVLAATSPKGKHSEDK